MLLWGVQDSELRVAVLGKFASLRLFLLPLKNPVDFRIATELCHHHLQPSHFLQVFMPKDQLVLDIPHEQNHLLFLSRVFSKPVHVVAP